jgi:hypothetical protein
LAATPNRSLTIKSTFFASTRDNSVEQEAEADEELPGGKSRRRLAGNDLFTKNLAEEDEYIEKDFTEDKYIGEEYPNSKEPGSSLDIDSADEVAEEFKSMLDCDDVSDGELPLGQPSRKILRDLSNAKGSGVQQLNSNEDEFQLNREFAQHKLKLISPRPVSICFCF